MTPLPPEGSHLLLWGKTGFILPPLSVKEKNSCGDAPSGHHSLFSSTEGVAWRHRPPVLQRASPYCWAPGGAGCARSQAERDPHGCCSKHLVWAGMNGGRAGQGENGRRLQQAEPMWKHLQKGASCPDTGCGVPPAVLSLGPNQL